MKPEIYDCENCGAFCRCFPIFASEADAAREPAIRRETSKIEPHLATEHKAYLMHPLPFFAAIRVFEGGSALPYLRNANSGLPPL